VELQLNVEVRVLGLDHALAVAFNCDLTVLVIYDW
jgi:hypothetical protein